MGTQTRERDRYRRASLGERLGGELAALRRHPGVMAIIAVVFGGWLVLVVTSPRNVRADVLLVGDCLYIPNPTANKDTPGVPTIGQPSDVADQLLGQGAERASCTASHGHEVLRAWSYAEPAGVAYPGASRLAATCDAGFPGFIGHPIEGSEFAISLAAPTQPQWDRGARIGVCLVNRADGKFMTFQAQGSGR